MDRNAYVYLLNSPSTWRDLDGCGHKMRAGESEVSGESAPVHNFVS